jgi:DNA-directed RNA polymerase subunit M/transcription elongation factor TFIIS
MEAATKVKKPRAKKAAAPASVGGGGAEAAPAASALASSSEEPAVNQGVPEGGLATTFTQAKVTPPDLESTETSESSLRYCPVCENYLYMQVDAESQELRRMCRKCGFKEESPGGLVMEMMIQQRSTEGYKILLNEFTKMDPTLPHLNTIKCPNKECASNTAGAVPDIIFMKYDPVNLKYLYICNIEKCGALWRSKGA